MSAILQAVIYEVTHPEHDEWMRTVPGYAKAYERWVEILLSHGKPSRLHAPAADRPT